MKRRRFIQASLTTTSMLAIQSRATSTEASDIDVLIIGAGVSGLAAARQLTTAGLRVIVLEARDRLGGRIWTAPTGSDLGVDLGASWIHGISNNPIYQLAQQFKIQTKASDFDQIQVYDSTGQVITDSRLESVERELETALEGLESVRSSMSAQDQLDRSLLDSLQLVQERSQAFNLKDPLLQFSLNATIEHEFATDLNTLSTYYWDESEDVKGDHHLFPQGYDQIIQVLATDLDIRLQQVVQKIAYGSAIEVITNQATFKAKYGIVTLPLGVLQAGSVTFDPPLPPSKQQAIKRLGMGLLNKVILTFPERAWPEDIEFLGYVSASLPQWSEWVALHDLVDKPVLMALNSGSFARQMESWTDLQIIESALTALKTMLGSVPDPEHWVLSRWGQDPFALGSYSYYAVNSTPQDRQQLAAPLQDRLVFAGEATATDYPSTVHGAYTSGQRAAQFILEQIS